MPTDGQRTARAAFDAARASFGRLTSGGDPHETAAALVEAWDVTEQALGALAGTSVLTGVAVVRELRQRSLLGLDDAHAFVDLHAAAERAREPGYVTTSADLDAARTAEERMDRVLARDLGVTDPPQAPYSGPVSSPTSTPRDAETVAPPPLHVPPPVRTNKLALLVVAVSAIALVAAGVYYFRLFSGEPDTLRTARAAFAAGDRLTARNAFSAAAGAHPALAEPHIYLGRIAREEGNYPAASAELRLAVELEPDNYLAHRELAAFLLATGQLELARSFYQRAIELNPTDRVALGYMGCTLLQLGRVDLADRFLQRAGPGDWLACQAAPRPAPPNPAAPPR